MSTPIYEWRSSHLLFSLLALVMFHPVAMAIPEPWGGRIMNSLTTIVMLTAVWWTEQGARHRIVAVLLVVPATFAQWLRDSVGPWAALALVAFFLYLIGLLSRRMLKASTHTVDRVLTAISMYLLITVMFGSFYYAVYEFNPNGFHFTAPPAADAFSDMLYFSFVTILSLGYGDIVPVTPTTRMAASMEAFVGAFFVAILIARLVSAAPAPQVGDPDGGASDG